MATLKEVIQIKNERWITIVFSFTFLMLYSQQYVGEHIDTSAQRVHIDHLTPAELD